MPRGGWAWTRSSSSTSPARRATGAADRIEDHARTVADARLDGRVEAVEPGGDGTEPRIEGRVVFAGSIAPDARLDGLVDHGTDLVLGLGPGLSAEDLPDDGQEGGARIV